MSSIPSRYLMDTGLIRLDKPIHVLIFFVLGWLAQRAFLHQGRYPRLREYSLLISFLFVLAYGIFDESHQAFIPGRQPDVLDVLADGVGGLLFVLVAWLAGGRGSGQKGK
ncbi:MAG: VanZ family protein [Bacteroidota bacterium]